MFFLLRLLTTIFIIRTFFRGVSHMTCVLGIESSCDETGIAIYDSQRGLCANVLHSQIEQHAKYGGVVPELASRDHVRKLVPLFEEALQQAQITKQQLDVIAYTKGPGLMGALLTGASFAKSLAFGLSIPSIGIHHLEAHLMAPMLETPAPPFPFLALLVSGGHSQILEVQQFGQYKLLGETLDDAVGEAFDKTAKLMGLSYPGGPKLAQLATKGNPLAYKFPRPMTNRPGLDMSFSGLKTQVLTTWLASDQTELTKANIAASFQKAICDTLVIKCKRAIEQTQIKNLVVSGGVSANICLRESLSTLMANVKGQAYYPRMEFCTDNGAMAAYLGWRCYTEKQMQDKDSAIICYPRLPLSEEA